MVDFAGRRDAAAALSALAPLSLAAVVAVMSGCSSPQHASSVPGTTPAVWTGSPAPSAAGAGHGSAPAAAANAMTTHLKGPDGVEVATAKFEFNNGFATITIETSGGGHLAPGFHGVHIHKVGKCEPNSLAPGTTDKPGDFLSAGGHFQAPGHTGRGMSGDLSSLQVRADGSGMLMTTTDAFTMADLMTGERTAIIIHAGSDNFANIPPERYNQVNGAPGPDETTMTTGDAGKRVACGVIGSG
jgi:superoxide dismutase, Cu-Zn family